MTTDKKIKELAERYAEFTALSPVDQLRVKLMSKEFLTWICKTHCIVEKEEIEDFISENRAYKGYDGLMNRFPEDLIPERTDWSVLQGYADGLYYLIEDIKTMLS